MKAVHQQSYVNHQKTPVPFQPVDRTHNAHVCRTELPNAHVYQALSKVQTRYEDALNRKIHVNHSHVVVEHRAMLHAIQCAIVQNQQLAIHSDNVVHQL